MGLRKNKKGRIKEGRILRLLGDGMRRGRKGNRKRIGKKWWRKRRERTKRRKKWCLKSCRKKSSYRGKGKSDQEEEEE